jgi:hypothetical protein
MSKLEPSCCEPSPLALTSANQRQTERRDAAYLAACQEIDSLAPGEAIQYHEGNLAADIAHDPAIAGRGAAYRHAGTQMAKGALFQRRIRCEWYQYIFRRFGT